MKHYIDKKFCSHCNKPTYEKKYDDSFDYSGTHCTHGKDGTHHDSHIASACCDEEINDGRFVICKCGNEIEVSVNQDLPFLSCKLCGRIGNWETDY